jgi:hypothetical protein
MSTATEQTLAYAPPRGSGAGIVLEVRPGREAIHLKLYVADAASETGAPPPARMPDYAGALFAALSGWWHEATDFLSSPSDKQSHIAYRQIIDEGERMVPYILGDLITRGGNWYGALGEITHENPVARDHEGHAALMKEDWLRWAAARGIDVVE